VGEGRVEALKEIWGIDEGQRVILNAARLTNWKGQRVLIAAADRLARRGELDDACVVLAGDDQGRAEYRNGLLAQIEAAGLSDRVRLVGHVSDMPAALKLAHIAVVASIEPEAFGRAAAEAQAMMCPVVATDIGAPPETVLAPPRVEAQDRTGWLVPSSDPGAMAEAMSQALALSQEERGRMGARARSHVTGAFSLDNMKRQTLAIYDELLGTQLEAAYLAGG
jgi:glycosyltransferase involved in cell wall biosynthesis